METHTMLVVWKNEHASGHDVIDAGHHLVIEAINHLNEAETEAEGHAVAGRMLPALLAHLPRQFEYESALMTAGRSPLQADHEGEHRRLLILLSTLHDHHQRGGDVAGILLLNLVCFMAAHLRGTDGDTFTVPRRQAA